MTDSCEKCGSALLEGESPCPACGEEAAKAQREMRYFEAADPGWWWEYGKFVIAGTLALLVIGAAVLLLGFAVGPKWFAGERNASGVSQPAAKGAAVEPSPGDLPENTPAAREASGEESVEGSAAGESGAQGDAARGSTPEEVVSVYFEAMQTEDVDLLMSTLSTASLEYMEGQLGQINQEMVSMRKELGSSKDGYAASPEEYAQLMAMVEGFPCATVADLFRQSFSFSEYRFEGLAYETVYEGEDRAAVTVTAGSLTSTFIDGETQTQDVSNEGAPLRFALVNEDGKWGIDIEASDMLMSATGE